VQERTSAGHPAVTYTRGLDMGSAGASPARAGAFAGSFEGAGGIGGLLARTAHASTSPYQPSTSAFYHADGNGNVTYLLNQDRSHGASYKYDPYGRQTTSTGPLASANLMRFSSKLWHDHSASYYYGYRFYLPELQRWLNRDPVSEAGGLNLYVFVSNASVNLIDPQGLWSVNYSRNTKGMSKSTIHCMGGKVVPYVAPAQGSSKAPCIKDCIEEHEKVHVADATKLNNDICKNVPDGTVVAPDNFAEHDNSELRAHEAQAECLKKCLNKCKNRKDKAGKDAAKEVKDELDYVNGQINFYKVSINARSRR